MNTKQLTKATLIVGLISTIVLTINLALSSYVLCTSSFQASMGDAGESLDIAIKTNTGRRSPLAQLFEATKDWISSYTVGGSPVDNTTLSLSIQITGSNVGSQASVDYYVEARETDGQGTPYRFLAGNSTSITVGGSALQVSDERTINQHLTQMGLATTQGWTIDYYVYVIATVEGAVSGETLTTEISYTKFDTVTYSFEDPGTWTNGYWVISAGYAGVVRHSTNAISKTDSNGDKIYFGSDGTDWSSWVCFDMDNQNAPPPQGATIQEAYLQLYSTGSSSTQNVLVCCYGPATWSSNYVDNYAEWGTRWNMRTDTYTSWSSPSWGTGFYNTTDIHAPIQEVIDEGGYLPTGRIVIFLDADDIAASKKQAYGWASGTYNPRLYLRYTTYSASWYEIPPLSVTSLPISMDLAAVLAVIIAAIVVVKKRMEENKN